MRPHQSTPPPTWRETTGDNGRQRETRPLQSPRSRPHQPTPTPHMKGDNRRQWETTGDKTTSEPKKPTTPTNTKAARSKVALRTPTVNCLGNHQKSNSSSGFDGFFLTCWTLGFSCPSCVTVRHLSDSQPRTCLERRHKRGKASRKRDVDESKNWFREWVWSHYQQYKAKQLSNAVGAFKVDGEASKEEILSQCLPYCTKMVSARVQVVLRPRKDSPVRSALSNGRQNGRSVPLKRAQEESSEMRAVARRRR